MQWRKSAVVLLSAVLVCLSCSRPTEEDRVRKVIVSAQKAAEEKKVLAVQEHLSRTYHDPQGYDYDGIRGLLAMYFFRHRAVSVSIPSVDVAVKGSEAEARFQAVLSGRTGEASAGAVLPEAMGLYDFTLTLRKESDAWKVVSARWMRAGEGDPGGAPK